VFGGLKKIKREMTGLFRTDTFICGSIDTNTT